MTKILEQTRRNAFISPGVKLGVIEEFIPGNGTYVEDGNIYSLKIGQLFVDKEKRELRINPLTHQPLIPKVGDIVIGEVTTTQEKILMIEIIQINEKLLPDSFTGIMHISDVSQGYVKIMTDAFRIGDTIRAKVISTQNREFHLTTRDDNLGVIQTSCIYCGGTLLRQRNNLRCSRCNKIDRRKIAVDYGRDS